MNRLLTVLLIAVVWVSAVAAEISNEKISAYNTAIQRGDREAQIAAARNLAAEAMANPADETAGLLAYEAAWTLCKNDMCEDAVDPAEFARLQPTSDPAAHPVAGDRDLLVAYAAWKARKSRATRQRLDAALAAVLSEDPSMLSLTAFLARYSNDTNRGEFGRAARTADEAATHFKQVETEFPYLYISAEMSAIAASFNDRPSADAQRQMAHLEGRLLQMRNTYEDRKGPDWLKRDYYRASAWSMAMSAYFSSSRHKGASEEEISEIMQSYEDQEAHDHHDADGPVFCEGGMNRTPRPNYPTQNADKGLVGAALIGFDIEDGELVNLEILAEVPDSGFAEAALKSMESLRWEFDDMQPDAACKRSRGNMVYPFLFQMAPGPGP